MLETKTETRFIQVTYWVCGNPDHRHKTEDLARTCIKKQSAPSCFVATVVDMAKPDMIGGRHWHSRTVYRFLRGRGTDGGMGTGNIVRSEG